MVDLAVNLSINQEYKSEELLKIVYERIEGERERFDKETTLVGNVRNFFRNNFNENHLRKIITKLESILSAQSTPDDKRKKLLLQIKKDESKIYLRLHQKLLDELRRKLL